VISRQDLPIVGGWVVGFASSAGVTVMGTLCFAHPTGFGWLKIIADVRLVRPSSILSHLRLVNRIVLSLKWDGKTDQGVMLSVELRLRD
jgi:hypothetical protein